MINKLFLQNFKCFDKLELEMSNLNILAGINGMGKSTVIQALLLMRQASEMDSLHKGIYLNGELINIGTGYDLLYRNSDTDEISIELSSENSCFNAVYKYNKDSDFQSLVNSNLSEINLTDFNIFGDGFSYISAERLGPQKFYMSSYRNIIDRKQIGVHGEYFADYLAERGSRDHVVNNNVLHKAIDSDLLIYQMEGWMSEFSPGIHFNPTKYTEAGIVNLEYSISNDNFSAVNVGFGLSYVSPIVLSLLKAQRGDMVLLENPEAHLHPKGQRKMGELIARAASGGVQIILETHSDHILNGIRLSVKKNLINKRNIRTNYFYLREMTDNKIGTVIHHEKCSPVIMEDGSLSDWPDGFFDEWDKAVEELF